MKVFAYLLNKVIEKTEILEEDIIIYRGIKSNYIYNFEFKKDGVQYTFNPNFSSGTLNYDYAKLYTDKGCCLLIIRIPKGAKIIFLDTATYYQNSQEIVIPSNSIFRIIQDDLLLNNIQTIILEYVLPSEEFIQMIPMLRQRAIEQQNIIAEQQQDEPVICNIM
jgi:hypothetical protein